MLTGVTSPPSSVGGPGLVAYCYMAIGCKQRPCLTVKRLGRYLALSDLAYFGLAPNTGLGVQGVFNVQVLKMSYSLLVICLYPEHILVPGRCPRVSCLASLRPWLVLSFPSASGCPYVPAVAQCRSAWSFQGTPDVCISFAQGEAASPSEWSHTSPESARGPSLTPTEGTSGYSGTAKFQQTRNVNK